MPSVASVRMSTRPSAELEDAVIPRTRNRATMPEQALYGVFAPQLAAALTASANGSLGETARFADRIILKNNAAAEAERYSRDLATANEAQQRMLETEGYYGILGDQQKYLQGDVDRGMGGARRVVQGPDGHYGLYVDPTMTQVANANTLNTDQSKRFSDYASAIKTLRDAGVAIPDQYLGELLTPPTQAERVPVTSGTTPLTPDDETARYSADQGLTAEQQMEIAETRAAAKADGDDIEVTVKEGEGGVADVTYKGSPEALMRRGIDPNTGKKLNPNAGAQGGGAPAKPAAKPVADARAISAQLYGPDGITEGRRDPNSALGRKNPNSYHVRTGAAVDRRPIKGMTFEQYVDGYRKHGYEIIEALDEVKHPSKHATGPHWHVVLGQPRDTSAMYAARLKTNPMVESATPIGNGSVLVRLKDGTQRVYKNGRRIG